MQKEDTILEIRNLSASRATMSARMFSSRAVGRVQKCLEMPWRSKTHCVRNALCTGRKMFQIDTSRSFSARLVTKQIISAREFYCYVKRVAIYILNNVGE